jgi:hypothetical protein
MAAHGHGGLMMASASALTFSCQQDLLRWHLSSHRQSQQ